MQSTEMIYDALSVIVEDPRISQWLKDNDPKALDQASEALTYFQHHPDLSISDALAIGGALARSVSTDDIEEAELRDAKAWWRRAVGASEEDLP